MYNSSSLSARLHNCSVTILLQYRLSLAQFFLCLNMAREKTRGRLSLANSSFMHENLKANTGFHTSCNENKTLSAPLSSSSHIKQSSSLLLEVFCKWSKQKLPPADITSCKLGHRCWKVEYSVHNTLQEIKTRCYTVLFNRPAALESAGTWPEQEKWRVASITPNTGVTYTDSGQTNSPSIRAGW